MIVIPPSLPSRLLVLLALLPGPFASGSDFVNFETPQVHPVDLNPSRSHLALCNTADYRLEIFTLESGTPVPSGSIPVGVDPVSVRFRTDSEAWVVNQLSDSISVVDLNKLQIVRTIQTNDEPADVVFAGDPLRAYVTCSQADLVQVFDAINPTEALLEIPIEGEDPRALCASADGSQVFVAIFESGNGSTILGGGADVGIDFPPNVVNLARGPHGGLNPAPNSDLGYLPPFNFNLPPPPEVGLIVRQDDEGTWRDDTGANWTNFVSGSSAPLSGRPRGWELIDNDIAIIDTQTNQVTYAERLMNACMAMGINPSDGSIHVVGTDATNEVRFEPVVNGTFVRVLAARLDPTGNTASTITDLNPHLHYDQVRVPQPQRDLSIGDPRGIIWNRAGTRAFVTGMGSNNLIAFEVTEGKLTNRSTIEVGEGPTGIALDEDRNQIYVLNRFDGSLSVINLITETEASRISFFDPTPQVIKVGRKHLYDTHKTSGLGQSSCASCHIDSRMDRLAWDLGDPSGQMKEVTATKHNFGAGIPGLTDNFTDFHPMKGPMTTQTLQDIIGKEPHHWRGDRDGIEEFNHAFMGLLGDDTTLTTEEMQEFEDYLATIHFPPNPFRKVDNTLPTNLPLPGHYETGRFGRAGEPLPNGNALRGFEALYRPLSRQIDRNALSCIACHTIPMGMGTDTSVFGPNFIPRPAGPNGERHHALVSTDGSTQRTFKIPHLRNLYDKVGFDTTQQKSRAGFGYLHDGSVDSLARFVSEEVFEVRSAQEVADLVALMLSFAGSDFPGEPGFLEPPGETTPTTQSLDAHAAVGQQVTISGTADPQSSRLLLLLSLAQSQKVDLIAKATVEGTPRGWVHLQGEVFQSDQSDRRIALDTLMKVADSECPLTFTVVPRGCGSRTGVDRDGDRLLDYDEVRDLAPSVPGIQNPFNPVIGDSSGADGSLVPDGVPDGDNDFDGDGDSNATELARGTNPADNLAMLPLAVSIERDGDTIVLAWRGIAAASYQVRYSHDLLHWHPAGDPVASPAEGGPLQWRDAGPPQTPSKPGAQETRYYRVEQIE